MTETESFSIINAMISKAQNRYNENGTLYLLWGWVIFICCCSQFIMQYFFKYENSYMVWFLTWLAAIYQVIYLVKKKKEVKVRTYADEIIGYIWMAFGVSLMIVLFILLNEKLYSSINPMILVLYGIPTFLAGRIIQFRPLSIGGFCCWALAVISSFVQEEFQQLLIAAAVICAWIIPGYILRTKFIKTGL